MLFSKPRKFSRIVEIRENSGNLYAEYSINNNNNNASISKAQNKLSSVALRLD